MSARLDPRTTPAPPPPSPVPRLASAPSPSSVPQRSPALRRGVRARSGSPLRGRAGFAIGVSALVGLLALALCTLADLEPLPASLALTAAAGGIEAGYALGDAHGDTQGDTRGDTHGDTHGDTRGDTRSDARGDTRDDTRGDTRDVRFLDRSGEPLSLTFATDWNLHDRVALHDTPEFLRGAFIAAEDQRFYEHHGPDWRARLAALAANLESGRAVRGASTLTEQVVRMLHPRPRTVWSRWLEGWEAAALERRFTKDEILEFYLNQVPYASNRRGVRQAARYYFARDLDTLSRKEMLALAVLVRSPSRFDLLRDADASAGAIARLADRLVARGVLSQQERDAVLAQPFALEAPALAVSAPHFLHYVRGRVASSESSGSSATTGARLTTTLDARLQSDVQRMLDERLRFLASRRVRDGAVLVVDHSTGEVLAWAVAGGGDVAGPRSYIDAVTTPRQPGSALKPFLYALALDSGWSAAEVIEDAPLTEPTSGGLHSYQNYSRRFYGPVTLRDALGNSLNIPALKTLQHVGAETYLERLHALGFHGLAEHPDFYGDGIALGSGAVTLLDLVRAYAALANAGVYRPLSVLRDEPPAEPPRRVFSAEAASLVGNILSDLAARELEFGRDSVLNLPVQTAVKTGTSSDFRDAWAVGFDYRYVVGVWMGNLDEAPTDGVTGSTGPALLLRGVFAALERGRSTEPLYLSPRLARRSVCVPLPLSAAGGAGCIERDEWFLPGTEPPAESRPVSAEADAIRLRQPTAGLRLAYDPRVPAEAQIFRFVVDGVAAGDRVLWIIDGRSFSSSTPDYRWPVARGAHRVSAQVSRGGEWVADVPEVEFEVK